MAMRTGTITALLLATVLLAVLVSIPSARASASSFTSVVDDKRVSVSLSYPSEVKRGTCFNVRVEINAHVAVTDLQLLLMIELRSGSSSYLLLSTSIPSAPFSGGPGPVANVLTGGCISPSHPLGVLTANLNTSYKVDATSFTFNTTLQLSQVRDLLYSELAALYAAANAEISNLRAQLQSLNKQIASLQQEIIDLKKEIERLKTEGNSLRTENSNLKQRIAELEALYSNLQKEYEALKKRFEELNDKYITLTKDYGALQRAEADLRDRYSQLLNSYEELRRDYELVKSDLTSLRALYDDLVRRHADLRDQYEKSVEITGKLRGQLQEKEHQLNALRVTLENVMAERGLLGNITVGQAIGLAGLAGFLVYRTFRFRRGREDLESKAQPPATQQRDEGNNSPIQKVISGRRVTIPRAVADALGLKVGDKVKVEKVDDSIIIKPLHEKQEEQQSGGSAEAVKGNSEQNEQESG